MGINAPSAARLAQAKHSGVKFTDTVTIGRMGLTVPAGDLKVIVQSLGLHPSLARKLAGEQFAEQFFQEVLGTQTLRSVDYSPYQGVGIVHDMNQPVSSDLHQTCDVLYDGGAMEHIFDVKQVLTNYMNMVRVGGRIFINVPANNLFGHGFYQFSSELFYRVFEPSNGYAVRDMLVIEAPLISVEASGNWRCYLTTDPAEAGHRIRLVSDKPLMLFVEAERVSDQAPFGDPPLQSDYKARWDGPDESATLDAPKTFSYLSPWRELKRRLKQRRKHSLRNRQFFEPTNPL